ncbi:MAG: hypothetical protein IJZ55_06690 [Lachnospiraceae bacterium]|nr:hypothetical protein [Lachnospiraceae bacterium]
MEQKSLEKATEILAALLLGEPVEAKNGKHAGLYEAYHESGEVNDALELMLKKLNLRVYEYNYALYLTVGEKNRVFGYSNEDLKRLMGLRLNKELYLCYYLIYQAAACFYQDSATYNYREYIKLEDLLEATNHALSGMVSDLHRFSNETPEETSFTALAISWDELPVIANEDTQGVRAGRGSKSGFVKLVFNFLVSQGLFTEVGERYYPTGRMHALIRRYFEEEKGRLYELQMRSSKGGEDGAAY